MLPPQPGSPRSIPQESALCADADTHTDTPPHACPHAHRANALLWPRLAVLQCFLLWLLCRMQAAKLRRKTELAGLLCVGNPTCTVHYGMAALVPFRSGHLSGVFLISDLFVSQEVQMNVGLAEGPQDTSDFDKGSQSNPIRDMHTVAAKPLRELRAARESPCVLPCPMPSTAGRPVERVLPRALHPQLVLLGLCWTSCAQLRWPSRSWEHLGCGRVSGHTLAARPQ